MLYMEQLLTWRTPGSGKKRGRKLTNVPRLLERQGIRGPHSALHRFVVEHCDFGRTKRRGTDGAVCDQ